MSTIFIGGSRNISRLSPEVRNRLDNVVASGHRVVVGDAAGADKAVQKHLFEKHYDKVTVYCSGSAPRNNLGAWSIHHVEAPEAKGFHFYAAKDREMAQTADFGLMIWDGKSPGTALNVMRLVIAGKIAVIINMPKQDVVNIKTLDSWKNFISRCSHEVQTKIKERSTPEEWQAVDVVDQPDLLSNFSKTTANSSETTQTTDASPPAESSGLDEALRVLNEALAHGDTTAIMNMLGLIAREKGMSHVARDTGLARESLYRSLDAKGNPEFATVLKVLSSMGLRLEAKPDHV